MSTPWKVALRLTRRQVRRAKGRSALVIAMIGVPVLLIAAMSTLFRTSLAANDTDAALRWLGPADALVTPSEEPIKQDPAGRFPHPADPASGTAELWSTPEQIARATGGQVTPYSTGLDRLLLRTENGALGVEGHEADLRKPVASGLATLVDGRLPRTDEEVVVSRALAGRGYATGERLSIDGTGSRTVVGVVRLNTTSPATLAVLGLPGSVLAEANVSPAYLVDTAQAIDWAKVQELNRHGLAVQSRAVILDPPPDEVTGSDPSAATAIAMQVFFVLVIVLEVVLLAGPAFAVSTRRQARQLALVVATGGTGKHVRRIVLVQAAVLGAGSAIAGAALGVGLVAVVRPWLEIPLGVVLYPLQVSAVDLGGLVVVGTLAAVLAALVPAAQAVRQDTIAVLAGRRGEVHGRRGWPVVGLVLAAAGAVAVLAGARNLRSGETPVALGTVAIVLGAILVMPAVVRAVGRVGGRFPLSLRLATRDAARNTSRTAPVIAAIMATVSAVTVLAIAASSDAAEQRRDYQPSLEMGAMSIDFQSGGHRQADAIAGEIVREIPGARPQVAYETTYDGPQLAAIEPGCAEPATCVFSAENMRIQESARFYWNLVASPSTVAAWLGRPLTAEQQRVLDQGGVLVSNPRVIRPDGTARAVTHTTEAGPRPTAVGVRELSLPAAALPRLPGEQVHPYLTAVAMTPATAERLGLPVTPSRILVPPPAGGISTAQEERVSEFTTGVLGLTGVYVERGYRDFSKNIVLVLGVIAGLILVVATGTSTALALDDARPDFATLAAIGASPRTRRATAAAQAAVTGVLGALFGVLVGVVPGLAISWPLTANSAGGHIVDLPWLLLGAVVVAVPLLAVLGAAGLTRSRLAMVRRVE